MARDSERSCGCHAALGCPDDLDNLAMRAVTVRGGSRAALGLLHHADGARGSSRAVSAARPNDEDAFQCCFLCRVGLTGRRDRQGVTAGLVTVAGGPAASATSSAESGGVGRPRAHFCRPK
jgi:hypothetical protein